MRHIAKTDARLQRWLWLCCRATELMCATALLLLSLLLLTPDQRESISRIEFKNSRAAPALADACRGCGVQAELSLDRFQFQIRVQPWAGLTLDYRTSGRWSFRPLDWGRTLTGWPVPDKQWTVAGHFPDTRSFPVSCKHLLLSTADSSNMPERRRLG